MVNRPTKLCYLPSPFPTLTFPSRALRKELERMSEPKEKDCESAALPTYEKFPPYEPSHEYLREDTTYPTTNDGSLASKHEQRGEFVLGRRPSLKRLFKQNILWFFMFTLDVIFVLWVRAAYFERLPASYDEENTIVLCDVFFFFTLVPIGVFTSWANWQFFIDTADYYYTIPCGAGHTSALRRILTWILVWISFVALVPGIFVYSIMAFLLAGVMSRPESCLGEGYMGTILVQVNTADQASLYPPRSNNATISASSMPRYDPTFGLNLVPAINVSSTDVNDFRLVASPDLTSPDLRLRLRNDYVSIQLAEKTYEWGYTGSELDVKRGNFSEGPSGPSFPSLDRPMYVNPKSKGTWSLGEIPSVEWVDDSGTTILKTASYRQSIMPCNELRMCFSSDVAELILHPKYMEAIMVPLARTMIKMMKYGLANC